MDITLQNARSKLHTALLAQAAAEQKSVDEVANVSPEQPVKRRELSFLIGSWEPDPPFDAVLEEQHRIDPGLWQ